jgi:membrane-associated phospholipid phosphatase
VPLLIFAAVAVEAVLKIAIQHPAPPDEGVRTVDLIPTVHVPFPNSFPSGHVMRVTFLAAIVRGVPGWMGAALVVLMIASRVYLAEHWLSDCIGGLALGLIAAGVGYALFGRRDDGDRAAIGRPGAQRRR